MTEKSEKKNGIQKMEMQAIIQMLKTTAERAEHLRMTGGPGQQGSAAGTRQYNAVLKRIRNFVFADPDLFTPLEEDASFVDLAMSCEQLAAYLEGMTEAAEPTRAKKPPTQIMGPVSIKISDPGDVGNLGDLIRQAMPAFLKGQMKVDVDVSKAELKKKELETEMNDLESKIAALGAQMQVIAERMHKEELSSEEIRGYSNQMRELLKQQSSLVKKYAAIRAHKEHS